MQRLTFTRLLALVITCGLLLSPSAIAAGPQDSGGDRQASPAAKQTAKLRGGNRKAHRTAVRRRARKVKRQRRAARVTRRHLAAQKRRRATRKRRAGRRYGIDNQTVVTRRQTAVAAQNPNVLFRGDFEAGFDGWHVQSIASRATLLSGAAFQGAAAAGFEVQDGDIEPETGSERSEVSGPTFDEGQDLYIRDAIRVPGASSFDGSWQIVQQLHETSWGGSPGIAVFLADDDRLSIGSGDGDTTYWEGTELQRDRWYDLVYRVYLSRDSGAGFVEVWLDGVQQGLEDGTRAYGQTIQTGSTYIKAGIYRSRSSTGTSLVEHDAIVVGASFAAATSG